MQGGHKGDEIKPVETLSTTFLQSLVSDRMDIDLGEEYKERVQEIVNDLEESGREGEVDNSPSRGVKEELIERENRKTGDGKVSSDSAEEGKRIVIDDSTEGESFMVRTMQQEEGDEPAPLRDLLTPTLESTPCEGHEREGRKASFRPIAPKKQLWVQPEPREGETEEEEDRKSSVEIFVSSTRVLPRPLIMGPTTLWGERQWRIFE